jgi:hypothetical protein
MSEHEQQRVIARELYRALPIVFLIVIVLAAIGYTAYRLSLRATVVDKPDNMAVRMAAVMQMRQHLRTPGPKHFPVSMRDFDIDIEESGCRRCYTVTSHVEAINRYGDAERIEYRIIMEYLNNDHWVARDITLLKRDVVPEENRRL